jgi:DNA repair ATPase RecN
MKNLISDFIIALTMLAVAFLSSCQSNADKLEEANKDVAEAQEELAEARADAREVRIMVANEEEWRTFKSDAEVKIDNYEKRIEEIREDMKKPGKNFDETYRNNIDSLEERNKDLRKRMGYYENNQSDWDKFKREFNHDMDELGKALKDLTVNNAK